MIVTWPREHKLSLMEVVFAAIGIIIAVVFGITQIIQPEIRSTFGLDNSSSTELLLPDNLESIKAAFETGFEHVNEIERAYAAKQAAELKAYQAEETAKRERAAREMTEWARYAFIADNVPNDFHEKLREIAYTGGKVLKVAFAPNNRGWVILQDKERLWNRIPQDLADSIREVRAPIKQIAFTPESGWLILHDRNGYNSRGCPQDLLKALNKFNKAKHSIDSVSFAPNGGWIIIYNNNQAWVKGITSGLEIAMRKASENGVINDVVFTPNNGWALIYNGNQVASEGIPSETSFRLTQLNKANRSISVLAFTQGGWVVAGG